MGGPAGGNGGRGGDVYLRGVRRVELLAKYTSNPGFSAGDGGSGGKNSLEGKSGDDVYVDIPIGSLVTNVDSGEVYEVLQEGQEERVLRGGAGGYGNEHFKSSRNVSPYECTKGRRGVCARFRVELRLIADAGLIGFPNAGKSTLLNSLTNSKAKVGDYAFTTLDPNLGALGPYILADIPGLIAGAAEGKGLGDRFLRHIMRTRVLVHCISVERDDILTAYETIRSELAAYNPQLLDKQEILLLTKADTVNQSTLDEHLAAARTINPAALAVSVFDDAALESLSKELIHTLQS